MYSAADNSMVLNITTSTPAFHIRGLNSGAEYNVEIYAANARGHSQRTLFETFTLQVMLGEVLGFPFALLYTG